MADQARAAGRERPPQSPQNIKVVRSQKIAQVSPTDPRPPPSEYYDAAEAQERTPLIPRSHTPGHLSSRSQDRRNNKPADLAIRQRSQSSAAAITPSSSSGITSALSTPAASFSVASTKTPTPTSTRQPSIAENGEQQDSSAGSSKESSRRPTVIRATSAIAGRPAAGSIPGAVTRAGTSSRAAPAKGPAAEPAHTLFPPLADPKTAPDVPPAPSSGMYWSRVAVSGVTHAARRAHTVTLVGSNLYVFGGCDARACFNELYVLDADAFYWSTPHVVGEVPMPLRAMTCTAVGKKLVIFGGGDGPAYYNDVYVLDTVSFRWSKPRILGDKAPSKRRAHTACLYKNGIYVFGGGDGAQALNDIWRLDVSDINKMSWKLISGASSPDGRPPAAGKDTRPKARGYHTANMVGSKLIIYGGSDGVECFNDVWVYNVETHVWKSVHIPITYRRLSHTATIVGSYLFVIGGHDGNEYSNDVLLLNLVTMTWDRRKVYGLPPSGRGYHGTVLHDSRLLMVGGFDGSEVFGDVWSLELAVHAYYSQISHFKIEV
ncbi:galactose oxidase [Parathielavia appendiculata]|uniref:Galactose oxidase n=1 Tax=Parathielavia appendiculata TaxID=2587402 RepID=A0AAN6Z930_9PEZI|nr:galactose oxidase [Parathielavia appendiculata]